jgi:hypothetical protein
MAMGKPNNAESFRENCGNGLFEPDKNRFRIRNYQKRFALSIYKLEEDIMGFGRGALLWLIGIPLPIILLLALFMHH